MHCLARNEAVAQNARALGLTPHLVSLEDTASLTAIARTVDGIGHFAAGDSPDFLPLNRAAIAALLAGLRPGSSFIMQSGTLVFGDTGPLPVPTSFPLNPPPPLAERAALDQFVLDSSGRGVRTHVCYGSLIFGDQGAMIPNTLVAAAAKAGYSAYIAEGSPIWSACHIEDWAELIVRTLLDVKSSGRAVFSAAQEISMLDLAKAVAQSFSPPLPTKSVSLQEAFALWDFFAPGLAINQRFDMRDARVAYGWNPRPRDFAAEISVLAQAHQAKLPTT